ncbi:MAG TPA: 5'/3'-nucleotidase SurE [Anaerolineaceae bacterium]|nr:5'/3'-nucleotidase SurE [Anaerolineaceae bacterium]
MPEKYQILLTNDDGIQSPGLWAAAEALSTLGYVTVVAPREQSSGTGRSMPLTSDGIIRKLTMRVHQQEWTVYSVGGTPAQAVQHAIFEIMPVRPDLVVSGINYGENVGLGVTISGTVGAAMEAASFGIPALAVSLQTDEAYYLSYSKEIQFETAGIFTARFAGMALAVGCFPPDVDLLKIDLPAGATPDTPWEITRQSRSRYYETVKPNRQTWEEPGLMDIRLDVNVQEPEGTDIHAMAKKRVVSVTPISLDLTSRIDPGELDEFLRTAKGSEER